MAKIHQKTIVESDKKVLQIAHRMETGARALHRDLQRQLAEDGWDVPEECVEQLTRSLVSVLLAQNHRLSEAVCDRQEATDCGREIRCRRDEASREVYDLLVGLRRILHGTAGSRAVRAHFGRGKTPRQPREVYALARTLRSRLQDADTRRKLCGTLGSEETLLQWLRQVEEPFERLRLYLREVDKTEVAERRAVPAVEAAKAEMRERQKFAYRLLEGLYGLAGAEEAARALRIRESQAADEADDQISRPTDETSATERLGSRRTVSVAAPAAVEADREAQRPEPVSLDAADGPLENVDLHGSDRITPSAQADRLGKGRSEETTATESVLGTEQVPAGVEPPGEPESRPSEGAPHKVWNVFQLFKILPHRMRSPEESAEVTASEEKAA